jgi:hypothetical protein
MSESLKLIRQGLGVVDLSDVENEKAMNEQERRDYCAAVHAVYPRLEKDIKRFLYQQLLVTAKESADWEMVLFGRGAFDGMAQLLEHWRTAHHEHQDVNKPEGEFEKHSPVGEI